MLPARLAAPGEPGQTSDFPQRGASRLPLPRATHAGLEIAAKTALNGAGRAPDGCSARTAPRLSAQIRAAARQKDVFGLGGCPDTSPGLSKATREGFGVAPPLPVPHISLVSSPCSAAGAPSTLWHPAGTRGWGLLRRFQPPQDDPIKSREPRGKANHSFGFPRSRKSIARSPLWLCFSFTLQINKARSVVNSHEMRLGQSGCCGPENSSGARILRFVKEDRDLSGRLWREAGRGHQG